MNTRDTFGFALKATHAVINGEEKFIFKDPKTDTKNFKKSQKGLCYVYNDGNGFKYIDELSIEEQSKLNSYNLLKPVFKDGKFLHKYTLDFIRKTLN